MAGAAEHFRDWRSCSVAVYNHDNYLISTPMEKMERDLADAYREGKPYTDLYVVAHGWNYDVTEAFANYSAYLEYFETLLHPEDGKEGAGVDPPEFFKRGFAAPEKAEALHAVPFRPYFLFIVYDSVTRPLQDAAASLLPFELDHSIAWVTQAGDGALFLVTSWGESLQAYNNALGYGYPVEYRSKSYDDVMRPKSPELNPMDHEGSSGARVPVSMLLRAVIDRCDRYFELAKEEHRTAIVQDVTAKVANAITGSSAWPRPPPLVPPARVPIHCVGHSYGAKILLLAATEALVVRESQGPSPVDPIESLLLFNPALHPSELDYTYTLFNDVGDEGVRRALERIPRKAIVYSNFDYATGLWFDVSEIVINRSIAQRFQSVATGGISGVDALDTIVLEPVVGAVMFGGTVVCSVGSYAFHKVANLPSDFVHHVANNSTFGDGWWKYVLNPIHFFLPLDQLFCSGRAPDEGGLFRYTRPALGHGGLERFADGRILDRSSWFGQRGPLASFAGADSEIPPERFSAFADRSEEVAQFGLWDRERIYSFDATSIYATRFRPDGSHGDLRSKQKVDWETAPDRVKRDYTFDFVLRATKATEVQ